MKKISGKTILLLILALLLCAPSVVILIVNVNMWMASLFGFVAAIFVAVIAFTKKSKTYTTELTLIAIDPKSNHHATLALCELNGKQFKLVVPHNVCKEKLVLGAKYKVDYTAISADSDPTTGGVAVKLKRVD